MGSSKNKLQNNTVNSSTTTTGGFNEDKFLENYNKREEEREKIAKEYGFKNWVTYNSAKQLIHYTKEPGGSKADTYVNEFNTLFKIAYKNRNKDKATYRKYNNALKIIKKDALKDGINLNNWSWNSEGKYGYGIRTFSYAKGITPDNIPRW